MAPRSSLTVAVTGASGTVGAGLLPVLDTDRRIGRVLAIATRDWAPVPRGYAKVEYRKADVRDRWALESAFEGADVVVHLAFSLYGVRRDDEELAAVNVEGSRNALDAAAGAGAHRFVYTSSAAVYGFGDDRPAVDEDAPLEPEPGHFYSRHKVAAERLLRQRLAELPAMEWVFLRPCAVVGPHALGAAAKFFPRRLAGRLGALVTIAAAAGVRPPVPGPPVPLQFVHERDLGRALHRAVTRPKASGVYNIAGDGVVPGRDFPRLLGLRTLPVPAPLTRTAVTLAAHAPSPVPAFGWPHLVTRPIVLDTRRARRELGWRPEYDSRAALAATRRALAI